MSQPHTLEHPFWCRLGQLISYALRLCSKNNRPHQQPSLDALIISVFYRSIGKPSARVRVLTCLALIPSLQVLLRKAPLFPKYHGDKSTRVYCYEQITPYLIVTDHKCWGADKLVRTIQVQHKEFKNYLRCVQQRPEIRGYDCNCIIWVESLKHTKKRALSNRDSNIKRK